MWAWLCSAKNKPGPGSGDLRNLLSILKRIVMFSFGMSSVCHFGHKSEIVRMIPR